MSDVVCEVIAQLPTKYGTFEAHGYVDQRSGEHHVALVKGDIADGEPVLCRVHSECLTGDTFGSLRCDCGEQRSRAMRQIEKEGRGVFLYMRQEGRGIGLINVVCFSLLSSSYYRIYPDTIVSPHSGTYHQCCCISQNM